MKKITFSIIVLVVFILMIMPSCDSSSARLDKFTGDWKDKAGDKLSIMKEYDGIVVQFGKDKIAGIYDKAKNSIKIYSIENTITIHYIEKDDHLIGPINNAGEGEFERVR